MKEVTQGENGSRRLSEGGEVRMKEDGWDEVEERRGEQGNN